MDNWPFKKLDEIKFAHYLFGFDVAVISGHQEHYTLRHHYGIRGWQVEIIEPSVASNYSNVEEAVVKIMGGRDKVIVEGKVIRPRENISLSGFAGIYRAIFFKRFAESRNCSS